MAMHTWFECKIRYEKVMENGMQKKVTEPYLVDALSFTEAEARIIEEMTPFISGEFTVSDIKRANYSELFPSDEESADRWFKCKLIFITLDEKRPLRATAFQTGRISFDAFWKRHHKRLIKEEGEKLFGFPPSFILFKGVILHGSLLCEQFLKFAIQSLAHSSVSHCLIAFNTVL